MIMRQWIKSGAPWIWLNAAAVAILILLVGGLVSMLVARGFAHFWPTPVDRYVYDDRSNERMTLMGQVRDRETISLARLQESGAAIESDANEIERILLKIGNRDLEDQDFRWILTPNIRQQTRPLSAVVVERAEWGVFIGYVRGLRRDGQLLQSSDVWEEFQAGIEQTAGLRANIREIERDQVGKINHRMEQLRLQERRLLLDEVSATEPFSEIELERNALEAEYLKYEARLTSLYEQIQKDTVILETAEGEQVQLSMADVVKAWRPNDMSFSHKVMHFFGAFWAFVSEEPREANTEGGIFPAIFGTVLMVFIMTVVVFPFGVIAGIYLREYAKQGLLTRTIRIAVSNLAGVPSIVYGVFGLGFFIYAVGGTIDELFYEEALPMPTFGTGGLFWASLTLALLTLPVVIISTEEGLSRIPSSLRQGSLALGATRWETLWRTVLPVASPGIMTGLILAVARAAGEVAPLMLVGVVKLAPSLPVDGQFPFLHLERKFMHLGFHIYDVGFQSPNVEAARPLVYATAMLLVLVTLLLNAAAIRLRNRLRERYKGLET